MFVNVALGELRASGRLRLRLEGVGIMRDEHGPREGPRLKRSLLAVSISLRRK